MKSEFLVRPRGLEGLSAVVLSAGFANPLNALARVESDLRRRKVCGGPVLFDVLLANGTRMNRFFVGQFDGKHFVPGAFETADARRDEFASYCADVYREQSSELDISLLTPAMRFALRRGTPL